MKKFFETPFTLDGLIALLVLLFLFVGSALISTSFSPHNLYGTLRSIGIYFVGTALLIGIRLAYNWKEPK